MLSRLQFYFFVPAFSLSRRCKQATDLLRSLAEFNLISTIHLRGVLVDDACVTENDVTIECCNLEREMAADGRALDALEKIGVYLDELSSFRLLDPDVAGATNELKNELCQFIESESPSLS